MSNNIRFVGFWHRLLSPERVVNGEETWKARTFAGLSHLTGEESGEDPWLGLKFFSLCLLCCLLPHPRSISKRKRKREIDQIERGKERAKNPSDQIFDKWKWWYKRRRKGKAQTNVERQNVSIGFHSFFIYWHGSLIGILKSDVSCFLERTLCHYCVDFI